MQYCLNDLGGPPQHICARRLCGSDNIHNQMKYITKMIIVVFDEKGTWQCYNVITNRRNKNNDQGKSVCVD